MHLNEKSGEPSDPKTPSTPSDADASRPRRRFGIGVLLAVVILTLAASLGGVAAWQAYQRPPPAPSTAISVVDDAGRTVTVPSIPSRIVVLQPSAMDIVYRLGLRSDVVGVDCGAPAVGGLSADYAPWQIQNWSLSSLPCITWIPSLDLQGIVALDPGLVIGSTGIEVSALATLQDSDHIPSLYLNPSTLLGISVDVEMVAKLTGTTTLGASLVQQMSSELGIVQSTVGNASLVTSIPTVLVTFYDDPTGYYTFGPGTFGNDLMVTAGASNIAGNDTYANQGEISGSYVLAANPGLIVYGTGFGRTLQNYSAGPYWSQLGAVQAHHVFGIDATYVAEPDPTMVLVGLPTLFAIVHPGVTLGG